MAVTGEVIEDFVGGLSPDERFGIGVSFVDPLGQDLLHSVPGVFRLASTSHRRALPPALPLGVPAQRGAPPLEVSEQQSRELSPTHPSPRNERGKKFTSFEHAQRFLSAFSDISPHFRPGRHRIDANEYRREMIVRFATWNEGTGTATVA